MKRGTEAWYRRAARYFTARISPAADRPVLLRRTDLSEDDLARGERRRVPRSRALRRWDGRPRRPRNRTRGTWTEVLS